MENATKALLIAAAVLIAIVLIAMGIKLLSSTQGAINQSGEVASDLEASIFNSKFEAYEGKAVKGSQVKQLARKIIQNNEANIINKSATDVLEKYDKNKIIYINLYNKDDHPDAQDLASQDVINNWINQKLNINSTYSVSIIEYHEENGLVKRFKIRENS